MNDESSLDIINTKTFILSFMAIIWRRVWITAIVYCEHNKINLDNNSLYKSLKYNIFSKEGIVNKLDPYITISLTQGFLMPKTYLKNAFVEQAVKIYRKAYNIIKCSSKNKEIKFIKDYAEKVFVYDTKNVKYVIDDIDDINNNNISINNDEIYSTDESYSNISNSDNNSYDSSDVDSNIEIDEKIEEKHKCILCDNINGWDVNVDLFFSGKPYQHIIMKGLTMVLNSS